MNKVVLIFLSFIFISSFLFEVNGQSINTEFGKNRVQYHDDFKNWWQYESENFITYWYGKARLVGIPTMQIAEKNHDRIQKVLEHRINDKIEIIVYTDVSDLKQSNIGTEEAFVNKTGETKIVGNKMFVYFDGNHQNLVKKIDDGIARVYFDNMIFGSNIQEVIQNALLMNVPEWYKEGIVSYAASEWDIYIEDELRDIWSRNVKYRNFKYFSENLPKAAGHSFWFFIAQKYGKASIPNLLYLTKISRNIDNSFEYILNKDKVTLMEEWREFYESYFNAETGKYKSVPKSKRLDISNKKYNPVSHLKLSPNGDILVYVHNNHGKYRIILRDLKSGTEKQVFKYGYKNLFQETDFNYPLLAWHPTKPEISWVYEHRDIIRLVKYNTLTGEKAEQIIPNDFQRLYSISYINDMDYVFSANVDGWADLFTYTSKNRNYQRITTDYFDNLDAQYVQFMGSDGILFSSNRLMDTIVTLRYDTILPIDNFDLFFLPMGSQKAIRLTETSQHNERYPFLTPDGKIVCLTDKSGIINTFIVDPSIKGGYFVSNMDRNIIRHHLAASKYLTTFYKDGEYQVFLKKWEENPTEPNLTPLGKTRLTTSIPFWLDQPKKETAIKEPIKEGYKFQSPFLDPDNLQVIKIPTDKISPDFSLSISDSKRTKKPIEKYINSRAYAANKRFALSNVTTKLDNDILFEGLETYTGDRQQLLTNPLGFLMKGQVKDLFEDYALEAGMRLPTTFNGSEFFVVFDDKRKLIDRRYALYRKSNTYFNESRNQVLAPLRSRKTALLGMYQLRYPFDIYRSIRATTSFRNDRVFDKSSEDISFKNGIANEQRLSLRLEYVFDNSFDASLNIKRGSRYKVYSEIINRFEVQVIDGFRFDPSLGYTGLVGFDARHYVPLLKRSVLALRGAGATSFGTEKMLYYVGGVENGLFASFNENIPVPTDQNFAYKVNAFHLRGFNNNIRNGSTFLVGNSELRIPFIQYILGSHRGSTFFRNLQLIGFYDLGLAWHGPSPFGSENPLNTTTIIAGNIIELEIEYTRDPLVMGYGVGLRTQLFGYFVKVDYGWGLETRIVQKPRLYFSFGLDF